MRCYIPTFTLLLLLSISQAFAAKLYGVISDKSAAIPLPAVSVALYQNGKMVNASTTDAEGRYLFNYLSAGNYNLKVNYLGYVSFDKTLKLESNSNICLDIKLEAQLQKLQEVVVISAQPLNQADEKEVSAVSVDKLHFKKDVSSAMGYTQTSGTIYSSYALTEDYAPDYFTDHYVGDTVQFKQTISASDYGKLIENSYSNPQRDPLSTFSIDVDVASYTLMRTYLNRNQTMPADAVRIEEMINYFPYKYKQPEGELPFSIQTDIAACPWNEKHQLLRVALQGKEVDKTEIPPSNLVFLIDVSGSMMSPDKLDLVKKALRLLTNELRAEDKISMVVYAGSSGLVLPATSGADKAKILATLDNLTAGGSTAGAAGIQLAYQVAAENFIPNGNNRVILCTDGDFNVGVSSESELIALIEEKRESDVFLSVYGFGSGNYQDSKMEQLADHGNGNYAYIDTEAEARKNLVDQMGGSLLAIAKDVKIQLEFNPTYVKAYRLIGYENRALKNEDFANDKKDAGEIGAGICVTALYELITDASDEALKNNESTDLKYQTVVPATSIASDEMVNVKLRYKKPEEDVSRLLEVPLKRPDQFVAASGDFLFAAAVTAYAQLIRKSQYVGNANFDKVLLWASVGAGEDEGGYRKEFIDLVKKAKSLY